MIINHPSDLIWNEGELPLVESVSYNCLILIWKVVCVRPEKHDEIKKYIWPEYDPDKHDGIFSDIGTIRPWKDDMNSLRWVDSYGHGISNPYVTVKYWAWINKGE